MPAFIAAASAAPSDRTVGTPIGVDASPATLASMVQGRPAARARSSPWMSCSPSTIAASVAGLASTPIGVPTVRSDGAALAAAMKAGMAVVSSAASRSRLRSGYSASWRSFSAVPSSAAGAVPAATTGPCPATTPV
jgi:hypothetical protein